MFSMSVSEPSLTSKCTSWYVPAWSNDGVHENVLVPGSNDAPSGRFDVEYVSFCPSGSLAYMINSSNVFSFTDLSAISSSTGGLLTFDTSILMVSLSMPPLPSETLKQT